MLSNFCHHYCYLHLQFCFINFIKCYSVVNKGVFGIEINEELYIVTVDSRDSHLDLLIQLQRNYVWKLVHFCKWTL